MSKIIDFEKRGNVVRFYVGKDDLTEWYGDDWDDVPYEHNAGTVYDEYVEGWFDVAWPLNTFVAEPADGEFNSQWSKEDMVHRHVPCIVAAEDETDTYCGCTYFSKVAASGKASVQKVYFGDKAINPGDRWGDEWFHGGRVLLTNLPLRKEE